METLNDFLKPYKRPLLLDTELIYYVNHTLAAKPIVNGNIGGRNWHALILKHPLILSLRLEQRTL